MNADIRHPEADVVEVLRDPQRLELLRETGLLDSAVEPAFDRFTRIAVSIIGVDIALVTLVDDHRQFFKSALGLPEPWASLRQTPLSHSFCRLVVATGQPMVVNDSRADPRVGDNSAIDEMGVAAYLGVPITLSSGFCLGSICVIDTVPREWTQRDRDLLAELAATVVAEIELRLEIKQRREIQVLLEIARDQALEASRAKGEFLTNMSHELRTPMNAIIGFAGLLATSNVSDDQRDWALTIERAGTHLLELLSNILDLSKLDSGRLELEVGEVRLATLVEEAVRLFGPAAADKGVKLAVVVDPAVPATITGDPLRVRQVIVNLIGNALKFTAAGSVTVKLRQLSRTQDQSFLEVAVVDTGIGIAPEMMSRLFEKFVQLDGSTARRYGGTGLGLAISRQLAEQMGGTLTAESEPGVGSTFRFQWTATAG